MMKPWVAAVLSLFCPGLGHLYVGRPVRAVPFLLVPLMITVAIVALVVVEPSGFVLALLALLVLCTPIFYLYVVIDAYRLARTAPCERDPLWWQQPFVYAGVLVIGLAYPLLSAAFLRAEVLEAYKIPTMSMAPTIERGDRILVQKWGWGSDDVRRGDVVVFVVPEETDKNYVKRVTGLPGDTVKRQDGTTLVLPARHLWMVGDNVRNSYDSRRFGAVPFENLVGRVTYRYWPPSRVGVLPDRVPEQPEPEDASIGMLSARLNANETTAIATLRNVVSAQAQFQATGKVDRDGDGVGEFGGFLELSGAVAGRMGAPLEPPVLSSPFLEVSESGEFSRSGYLYRVFLPGPARADGSASGVGERLPEGYPDDRGETLDMDLTERVWCCYAWPMEYGTAAARTFFTNESGDIFACDVEGYSGSERGPAADAAFTTAGSVTGPVDVDGPGQNAAAGTWRQVN